VAGLGVGDAGVEGYEDHFIVQVKEFKFEGLTACSRFEQEE
jgi:hypothetical protein